MRNNIINYMNFEVKLPSVSVLIMFGWIRNGDTAVLHKIVMKVHPASLLSYHLVFWERRRHKNKEEYHQLCEFLSSFSFLE